MQVLPPYSSIIKKIHYSFAKYHKFFSPHLELMNYSDFLIYLCIIILSSSKLLQYISNLICLECYKA